MPCETYDPMQKMPTASTRYASDCSSDTEDTTALLNTKKGSKSPKSRAAPPPPGPSGLSKYGTSAALPASTSKSGTTKISLKESFKVKDSSSRDAPAISRESRNSNRLTDRRLSSEERKRIAIVTAQKLFSSQNRNKTGGQGSGTQLTRSASTKSSRPPAPPKRTSSLGKDVSRDFLTLACYNAVATGQLGLLKALQKTSRAPQVDKQGNTPLHVAAKYGQLKCLRWLQQYCSIPLLAKNARGETCAHVAALHGNLKCLQSILAEPKDLAAKLAAATERDNAGMTCLHLATLGNRDSVVSWLAAAFGRDLCLVKSRNGVLAIHLAAASGNRTCTEVLVQASYHSVNMRDVFGATPVYYAAQEGQLEILQFLVKEMDGCLDLVAFGGMTPLLAAAEAGHLDIIKFIMKQQGRTALLASTRDGATVFHYAAGNGHAAVLRYLLDSPDKRDLLYVADVFDRTPAHDAAENGHVECLQLLVESGSSVYSPDQDGETALAMAMRSANPQCVMYARALYEATVERCTSSKSFRKKVGAKLHHISSIMSIRALAKDSFSLSTPPPSSSSSSRCGGVFGCPGFPFRGKPDKEDVESDNE